MKFKLYAVYVRERGAPTWGATHVTFFSLDSALRYCDAQALHACETRIVINEV